MKKKERYTIVFIALVFVALAYFLIPHGDGNDRFLVHSDPDYIAALQESNTAVVRLVYPFTDASGPGAGMIYALQVLLFAGKTVILQTLDGNNCQRIVYTPTPEANTPYHSETNVLTEEECVAESSLYPTIEIRQGPKDEVVMKGTVAYISGLPSHIPNMVRYLILRAYPNADAAVAYMRKLVARAMGR